MQAAHEIRSSPPGGWTTAGQLFCGNPAAGDAAQHIVPEEYYG